MSPFWSRLHGGATHFPIALIFASAFFDALGYFLKPSRKRLQFAVTGYWLVIVAALGALPAVVTGLFLTRGRIGGAGVMLLHHVFVWPAFTLLVGAAMWRFLVRNNSSPGAFRIYLCLVAVTCALLGAAGFFGGELLVGQ